jgi:hypothetical protein
MAQKGNISSFVDSFGASLIRCICNADFHSQGFCGQESESSPNSLPCVRRRAILAASCRAARLLCLCLGSFVRIGGRERVPCS